jgi:hypothetical protein
MTFDFYVKQSVIRILSEHFGIEFALVFELNQTGYVLYPGTKNSVAVAANGINILLNHTHPGGTPYASDPDMNWLRISRSNGSRQVKSVILPQGRRRFCFSIHSRNLTYIP